MAEFIRHIFSTTALSGINILFLLGIALFGGTIGGRFFSRIRVPQVVGYIIIGIALGQTGLRIIGPQTVEAMQPFNYFALGLISFMIGGELKKEVFEKYGKQFLYILLSEGLLTFLVVSAVISAVSWFFFANAAVSVSLGILLGAIASATAPAATVDVLWEYKTRGPLTSTVLAIVALDDALALTLFAGAAAVAKALISSSGGSLVSSLLAPVYEITASVAIGVVSGGALSALLKKYSENEKILAFTLGMVLITLGAAMVIKADILLAAMSMGVMIANYSPRKSESIFKITEKFNPPIYVLFFVLFGAKLNVSHMSTPLLAIAAAFLISRTAGKFIGARTGCIIAKAPTAVRKYFPFCLLSQAGVAIGLSVFAGHKFPGMIGNSIVIVITATTFIVQIIGPPFVKYAAVKSGEAGLNITEEDLMKREKVSGIMDDKTPILYPGMMLKEILRVFEENVYLYYPVADSGGKLLGLVTIDTIKDTFRSSELYSFLVALDLMSKPIAWISKADSVFKAKQIFEKYNLELLPVLDGEERVVGVLDRRAMRKLISRKFIELHNGSYGS